MKSRITASSWIKTALLCFGIACCQLLEAQNLTIHAFVDANHNCTRDPGERPVRSLPFTFSYATSGSSIQTTSGYTDCNGTLVLGVNNLGSANTIHNLSLAEPVGISYMQQNIVQFLSSCFSFNNLNFAADIDVPFDGLPDTVYIRNASLYDTHSGIAIGPGDTLAYCDSLVGLRMDALFNQYDSCMTLGQGTYSVMVDGQLRDQASFNIPAGPGTLTTSVSSWSASYSLGTFNTYTSDIANMFAGNTVSPGLHKITLIANPYPGIVAGNSLDFYLYRDNQCAKVSVYSYLDCNTSCTMDPGEDPSATIVTAGVTIGGHVFSSHEEIDPQTGQYNGYKTLYIPSTYSGTAAITITTGAWSPYSICPATPSAITLSPGAVYSYTVGVEGLAGSLWNVKASIRDGQLNNPATAPAPGTTFTISISPRILKLNHCVQPGLVDTKMVLPIDFHFAGASQGTPAPVQVTTTPNGEEVIWDALNYLNLDSLVCLIQADGQAYSSGYLCIWVYLAHDGLAYYAGDQRCYAVPITNPTGIDEQGLSMNVHFYPNPTSDQLHLKSDKVLKMLRVSNLLGDVVDKVEVNSNSYDLSVEGLHPGVYILYATDASGNIGVYKFIKQ